MSNSVLMRQPIFRLELDMYGPALKVYVNNVVIYTDFKEGYQLNTSFPINHWMHPKDNRIEFRIYARDEGGIFPGYRAKINLKVHDHGKPESEHTIATLDFSAQKLATDGIEATIAQSTQPTQLSSAKRFTADPHGDVVLKPIEISGVKDLSTDSVLLSMPITLPNSLPLWSFFNSDELPDYDEKNKDGNFVLSEEIYESDKAGLHREYMKVQNALIEKNINDILPIFDERNKETDLAYYFKPGATAQGIEMALKEAINDPKLTLVDLPLSRPSLETEENNKLASLFRKDRRTAIGFNVEGGGATNFPIMFRKQGNQWIVTR